MRWLSLLLIIGAGLVFAACTPPRPNVNADLSLDDEEQPSDISPSELRVGQVDTTRVAPIGGSADLDGPSLGNPQADMMTGETMQIQNQQTSLTNQRGEAMKQISDFAPIEARTAIIVTSRGEVEIELFREEAPLTTLNFLNLAQDGFYNGVRFHRIIEDFMAQVGDPLSKDQSQQARWGTGGPGYVIADEFSPNLRHDSAGIVSMANSGPDSGGSQFFITYGPTPWLDDKHAVFGRVTKGMDVVEQLQIGDQITSVRLR